MSYKPLRDYGIIGDMRTAALVGRDGSIDWTCFPRFDSASVFARILDHGRGGHWSVAPTARAESSQRYESGTNVLETRFSTGGGELRVTDFMPVLEWDEQFASHHEIHRVLEARGEPLEVEVVFRPRFDYGRLPADFRIRKYGVLATDEHRETLTLSTEDPVAWDTDGEEGGVTARFRLAPGQTRHLVLRYDDDEVYPCARYDTAGKLARTRTFWRDWSACIDYEGPYRELVERSALVLKLLFYAPTGAMVAAPTTSLPERLGGVRNWDYRFSWLRDSTFTLHALHAMGKYEELDRYMTFLKKVCRRSADPLQVLFGIGGERDVPEVELPHLEGYMGSAPVRAGNGAYTQYQLDVYGEVMDAIHIWRRNFEMTEGVWELVRRIAESVVRIWRDPDEGVWEVRDEPRHFVFSKVMAWVALHRAVAVVDDLGLDHDTSRWQAVMADIRREVLELGWNEELQTFVQHYDARVTDAANVVIPLVRFLPPDDPRVLGTLRRIQSELGHPSGFIYRYHAPDGLPEGEGAFWVSTFQMAQALARAGHREEAVEVFEDVIEHASPLGLLSEEIDPDTGTLLGNYPQAFSHIGLINAAHVLARTAGG